MSRTRAFKQVDVFSAVPFKGNPVAVVMDAEGLDEMAMRAVANWTNLSETTFVTKPTLAGADYAVRIFTPQSELPFAGHPTLGTAHALLEAGICAPKSGRIVQQCAVGPVEIDVSAERNSFRLPRYAEVEAPEPDALIAAIGGSFRAPPKVLDVGPRWAIAELQSAEIVENLSPDLAALAAYERRYGTTGITVFAQGGARGITVRTFAPADGVPEDPVCGSGNGAVAAYRLLRGQIGDGSAYTAYQGQQVGRDGRVFIQIKGADIHVGGACVTCIDGSISI